MSTALQDLLHERTPLLPPPNPLQPRASPHPPRPKPDSRPTRTRSSRERLGPSHDQLPSVAALARAAAALQAGHLPSSSQLLTACDRLLASPWLDLDDSATGTLWEPAYGAGRVGTGGLSREGERVRLALRECVEGVRELVRRRNPRVETREGEPVGVVGGEEPEPGDGWQEFLWRCKASEVDVDLPSTSLPAPSPTALHAASSSLLTLLHLLLTFPPLRALLADLVLLLRDTTDVLLETARKEDHLGEGTVEKLEGVVEAATEAALGAKAVAAHDHDPGAVSTRPGRKDSQVPARQAQAAAVEDPPEVEASLEGAGTESTRNEAGGGGLEGSPGGHGARALGQKSPDELQDEFVDRVRTILVQLQTQPAYQRSMQTLLSVLRTYLSEAVSQATPHVHVDRAAPVSPSSSSSDDGQATEDADSTELILPLLEPFTGGPGSLSPLRHALRTLLSHVRGPSPSPSPSQDAPHSSAASDLRALSHTLDTLLERALLHPGWAGSAQSHRQLGELYRALTRLRDDCPDLARDVRVLLACAGEALGRAARDEVLGRAVKGVEELGVALAGWVGEAARTAGNAAGGEGLAAVWGDVVEWVMPRLLGVLKEVPLPRFEFALPTVSLAVDPPSLLATSCVPSSVNLQQSSSLAYLPSLGISTAALPLSVSQPADPALARAPAAARTAFAAETRITVEGMQLEINDVGYFARYHTGIPCIGDVTESGLLDLRFGHPDAAHAGEGLGFTLAARTPAPAGAQTLFTVRHDATRVVLRDLGVTPHSSSHPWLVWLLRPLLRVAVRRALEVQLREALLEPGAEWAGRVGWRVRERAGELRAEDLRAEDEQKSEEEGETARVWRWARAVWDVLVGGALADSGQEVEDEPVSAGENEDEGEDDTHPAWHVHLNRHGLAVDLEAANGTAGIGSEGVVIPEGDAPIPLAAGHSPPKGLARAAREEVQHEVRAGSAAARGTMRAAGEIGEEAERWEERVRQESRTRPHSWRSDAFDFDRV